MTDLERAAQLLVHDREWQQLPLFDQLKHITALLAEARREGAAEMRERAYRDLIRALPLVPEKPA